MEIPSFPENQSEKVISSFVPVLLRERFRKAPERIPGEELSGDQAVLLWLDICAFSPMANRLLQQYQDGVEVLSRILKQHYDPLLQTIRQYGGQPLLFAGDGVLAAWPCSKSDIREVLLHTLACAQTISSNPKGTNDLGEPLVLHVVVASGPFQLMELAINDGRWLYAILGRALSDLRLAAGERAPGEVLISANTQSLIEGRIKCRKLSEHAAVLDQQVEDFNIPVAEEGPLTPLALRKLEPFIPRPLSYNLDVERLRWIEELRPVNIVFVQLHDFAPESDDAHLRLQDAVRKVTPVIASYQGILGNVWFDEKAANLLIEFGPPPAVHQDNPARALKTAIQIHEVLEGEGFDNSIGVTSGRAFCGILGNDLLRQYTVIGDVVNLAARLSQLRKRGVCCDEATMKGATGVFHFGEPLMLAVKGQSNLVKVWEVDHQNLVQAGVHFDIPVVGRAKELQELLQHFKTVANGGRVAVLMEGESGLGKTKLLNEFRKNLPQQGNIKVLVTAGDAVEKDIPYFPWRSIFSALSGVDGIADLSQQQEHLSRFLGDSNQSSGALLNGVFGFTLPESDQVRAMAPHQRAEETKRLLVSLLAREAEDQKLVVIIDDAQWLDDTSWTLLKEVVGQIDGMMTVVALQSIEGFSELVQLKELGAIHYKLGGLSPADQEKLIRTAIGVEDVPSHISGTIIMLSRGNPFFCLELSNALVKDGALQVVDSVCELAPGIDLGTLTFPETIHGMVRRRIDTIDQGPKLALKVASVTGIRFATDLVQKVFPISQERDHVPVFLKENNRVGLILQELADGAQGYMFNNAVTRDVAYEMILSEQKLRLHKDTAIWYEEQFSENLRPFLSRLAYHWERAGDHLKGAEYLEQEAIHLFSNGFARESVEVGLKGIQLLGVELPKDPAAIGQKIGEHMGAIGALMAGRHPMELIDHKQLDDPRIERVILMMLRVGPFAFQSQQIELFALISVTCLRMTLEHGNGHYAADVYSMYSAIHRGMTGDRIGGYTWSELALALDKKNGHTLFSRVAFVHTWFHNHWVKPFASSLPLALEAAEAGMASNDILFACFNLSGYVVYQTACGRPLETIIETSRKHMLINGKRVMNAAFHLVLEMQFARAMAGKTISRFSFTDELVNEEQDLASIFSTQLGNQIGYYMVARVKLHAHYGDWRGALQWVDNTQPLIKAFEGQVAEIDLVLFEALAALFGAIETEGHERVALLERAGSVTAILKGWAELCPANYLHKALMLEAFAAGINRGLAIAEEGFDQAVSVIPEGEFLQDRAILEECRLAIQQLHGSTLTALPAAIEAYGQWGAFGKIDYLREKYS
ncbi:AAA family ATPase [Flavihumibacter rivuli]|uniref:AAA and adenylate/guanylate cyclase domain-containing protein n=1 Tax=Flavihumibacter rivuli TaxID=2838156 RepID=UPI001BDF00B8|nr:AAA and adenylate/guanylate cyclase domain-containing protein [Flavihumibacter rivuli]ULQ57687.1 AAA family ATPase [Flavihumibacter rivuli]